MVRTVRNQLQLILLCFLIHWLYAFSALAQTIAENGEFVVGTPVCRRRRWHKHWPKGYPHPFSCCCQPASSN